MVNLFRAHYVTRALAGDNIAEDYSADPIGDPDVVMFDEDGALSGVPGSLLVGSGSDGADRTSRIYAVRPTGEATVLLVDSRLANPNHFARAGDGALLITSDTSGAVLRYVRDPEGGSGTLTVLNTGYGADDLAVDADGALFAGCRDGAVRLFDSKGGLQSVYATGLGDSPLVAIGPGGRWATDLYVFSPMHDELRRYTAPGEWRAVRHGFGSHAPVEMVFDPTGDLCMSIPSLDRVVTVPCCPQSGRELEVVSTCPHPSSPARFSVDALSLSEPSYAWQYRAVPPAPGSTDWTALVEGANVTPDEVFLLTASGVDTESIAVEPGRQGWPGVRSTQYEFRCIISNECGSVASTPGTLAICPPDFDCDGVLNSQDFFFYLRDFFNGESFADFNGDGAVNSQDFFDFITALFDGCDA